MIITNGVMAIVLRVLVDGGTMLALMPMLTTHMILANMDLFTLSAAIVTTGIIPQEWKVPY